MNVDVVVLGCGWAGVLVSYILVTKGASVLCIEKANKLGGLLRTEYIDGFTVDVGGSHIIFSKDRRLLNNMLALLNNEVVEHNRMSFIRLNQYLVPYPLENGLYVLPPEERYEALISFLENYLSTNDRRPQLNLEEWINSTFGKWMAEKYMIPYNRKLWKRSLIEIDVDWLGIPGRLPKPDWKKVAKSAVGIPTTGYEEQAKFYYPARGGIQSLYKAVYNRAIEGGAVFVTNSSVIKVEKEGGHLMINDRFEAKVVYSTIPIPDLLRSLGESITKKLSFSTEKLADRFDYNKLVTVAVALNKPAPNQHWVYVPDEKIVFHRYAWISNYSLTNAPPGKSLVLAEITVPKNETLNNDLLMEKTLEGLLSLEVFREDEMMFHRMWVFEHGYPVHRVGLDKDREMVMRELREQGIMLVGRWGTWRYLNMDMVLKEVLEATGMESLG